MESGINAPLTVALRRIALYEAEILHLVVQNAETMGEREQNECELRRLCPEKHFYGCDRSSWVYA